MIGKTLDVRLPLDWIAKEIADQLRDRMPVDRHKAMVERLGEACSRQTAAKEIEVSTKTIERMMADGRLSPACEGTRVDVRSLADYIERRSELDSEARRRKSGDLFFR